MPIPFHRLGLSSRGRWRGSQPGTRWECFAKGGGRGGGAVSASTIDRDGEEVSVFILLQWAAPVSRRNTKRGGEVKEERRKGMAGGSGGW